MILSGKSLNAKKAFKVGLVDQVIPEGLFTIKAVEFARTQTKKKKKPRAAKKFSCK
jgi:enoyl-CoA hydratase/carnithine racemase